MYILVKIRGQSDREQFLSIDEVMSGEYITRENRIMNSRPQESAFEREFTVRYRLPRPLSRSFESILYARDPAEIRNKIEWCAATAVRFIAALRQALYLTTDVSSPPGPPGAHDFKLETDLKAFRPLVQTCAA